MLSLFDGFHVNQESFRAAVGAGELFAHKFSAAQEPGRMAQGDLHGADREFGTIHQNIAFPLPGPNQRAREITGECIRFIGFLLCVPRHDKGTVKFPYGPLGVKTKIKSNTNTAEFRALRPVQRMKINSRFLATRRKPALDVIRGAAQPGDPVELRVTPECRMPPRQPSSTISLRQ